MSRTACVSSALCMWEFPLSNRGLASWHGLLLEWGFGQSPNLPELRGCVSKAGTRVFVSQGDCGA